MEENPELLFNGPKETLHLVEEDPVLRVYRFTSADDRHILPKRTHTISCCTRKDYFLLREKLHKIFTSYVAVNNVYFMENLILPVVATSTLNNPNYDRVLKDIEKNQMLIIPVYESAHNRLVPSGGCMFTYQESRAVLKNGELAVYLGSLGLSYPNAFQFVEEVYAPLDTSLTPNRKSNYRDKLIGMDNSIDDGLFDYSMF